MPTRGQEGRRGPRPAAAGKDLESLYPAEAKAELKQLRDELAALEKAAPELPSAMGVTEGQVADLPVHLRGSHLTPGQGGAPAASRACWPATSTPAFGSTQPERPAGAGPLARRGRTIR